MKGYKLQGGAVQCKANAVMNSEFSWQNWNILAARRLQGQPVGVYSDDKIWVLEPNQPARDWMSECVFLMRKSTDHFRETELNLSIFPAMHWVQPTASPAKHFLLIFVLILRPAGSSIIFKPKIRFYVGKFPDLGIPSPLRTGPGVQPGIAHCIVLRMKSTEV